MRRIFLVLVSLIFLAASCNQQPTYSYSDGIVVLAGQIINIELADELAEQTRGLAGRQSLKYGQGMLFVFKQTQIRSFWMKNMKFPIDIIWINENRVVDLSLNAEPQPGLEDYQLKLYQPKTQVDAVLEVNAGWAEKNGIKVGDRVDFNQVKK